MSSFVILNFVFFQALWFSSVVGAGGYGLHWLALGALVPLTIHTWFSPVRRLDFFIATLMLCVGMLLDNLWIQFGILAYPEASFAPYWIGLLWFGLGMTLNHSLAFFRDRGWLGALIVGAFAPVTYLTGQRFGAVAVVDLWSTAWISLSWFALFYGVSRFARGQVADLAAGTAQLKAAEAPRRAA